MKEELYIRRSIPECMAMSLTLMTTNVKRMAAALWLPAVITAVLIAALSVVLSVLQMQWVSAGETLAPIVGVFALVVLLLAALVFLDARVYKLLNMQTMGFCLRRSAAVVGVNVGVRLIGAVIMYVFLVVDILLAVNGKVSAPTAYMLFIIEGLVVLVLLVIFFSPFIYALMKYAIEPIKFSAVWKSYRVGLRRVGFIIAFCLLCAIVMLLLYIIIGLPSVIVGAAAEMSYEGMAMGDPSGLPRYFLALVGVTLFFTSFIAIALHVWSLCAAYYMYASVEARLGRVDEEPTEEAPTRFERV